MGNWEKLSKEALTKEDWETWAKVEVAQAIDRAYILVTEENTKRLRAERELRELKEKYESPVL